jgi:hypothetical protein
MILPSVSLNQAALLETSRLETVYLMEKLTPAPVKNMMNTPIPKRKKHKNTAPKHFEYARNSIAQSANRKIPRS